MCNENEDIFEINLENILPLFQGVSESYQHKVKQLYSNISLISYTIQYLFYTRMISHNMLHTFYIYWVYVIPIRLLATALPLIPQLKCHIHKKCPNIFFSFMMSAVANKKHILIDGIETR